MNQVVIFYNPFLPELKISVNNKKLSSYSSLMSCRHKRFETWCHNLFTDLYREINSDFEVTCVSTEFISNWMEYFANKNPHCTSYTSQPLPMATSIYDRLAKLELLGCENLNTTFVPIVNASSNDEMIAATYEILEEQGIFEDISEDGINWSECPLANVQLLTCMSSSYLPSDFPCVIALCDSESDYVDIDADVPIYALVMGTQTRFIKQQSGITYFTVDPDDIGELIINILEEEVLCPILSDLSYNFPKEVLDFLTETEKEDLALICQASPSCDVCVPKECYVGRVIDLHPQVYPSNLGIEWRVISDASDVIFVDGGVLYPKAAGTAEVSVFVGDDPYPAANESIQVYQKELIQQINLFPSVLYMPVGGEERVKVSVLPDNAQNLREIRWESSDPSIADVDAITGTVRAIKCGRCFLTASTPETSSRVAVNVQPELEDIICPSFHVSVGAGEQKEWRYQTVPENAYGADLLRVVSSNSSIAEYRGGYIVGKGIGECRIYIKNQSGTINHELRVTVKKGNKFW